MNIILTKCDQNSLYVKNNVFFCANCANIVLIVSNFTVNLTFDPIFVLAYIMLMTNLLVVEFDFGALVMS